jgi:hypothetical protein
MLLNRTKDYKSKTREISELKNQIKELELMKQQIAELKELIKTK